MEIWESYFKQGSKKSQKKKKNQSVMDIMACCQECIIETYWQILKKNTTTKQLCVFIEIKMDCE